MSERQTHFVSGLPRSGSTLLCNILAQNPDMHTTPTSACHEALFTLRNAWGGWIEHQASPDLAAKHNQQRVLKSVLHSYHDTAKPMILDKGRGWLSLLELAEFALGRKAKVLVPVRNITQILASFEKLHRKQSETGAVNMDYFQSQTVEGRCRHLLSGDQVVGLAYNRLKDAIQRGLGDRLFIVEFDALTHDPEQTMTKIYQFLELPNFSHDFNNVEQVTKEDDRIHGSLDLHTIRPAVAPLRDDSESVLGTTLAREFASTEFWRK
jgi:sulfotransferase